jgi:hypothetical protein
VRVALIGPAHPDRGGAARHTTELAYRLAAAGHNVIIESWRASGPALICHTALPAAVGGGPGLTRTLLARADTVIVHSAAQAAQARALAPEVPIVIARMPPHLPAATPVLEDLLAERSVDLAPGPPKTRLLFFGVVRPDKGLDLLLQALARTPEHVTLTVAGEFASGLAETRELIAPGRSARRKDAAGAAGRPRRLGMPAHARRRRPHRRRRGPGRPPQPPSQ